MSANEATYTDSASWLQFPANVRISFLILSIIIIARLPLSGSLWLDEGITAWITKDELGRAITRAVEFQGQSPLYFILEWFTQIFLGSSEFALRALSVIGVVASAAVVFLLGRRIGGATYAWIATSLFLTIDSVQVAASSARPYGLGLFFSLAAVWALIRWGETAKLRHSLLYLFCFLMSVYLQYLFASMLLVHFVWVVLNFRTQKVKFISYVFQALLIASLLFPAVLHMLDLSERHAVIQFVPRPAFLGLVKAYLPPVLSVSLVIAAMLGAIFATSRKLVTQFAWGRFLWVASWYLFPPAFLFVASVVGESSLFLDRYFLIYTPAVAFTLGALPFLWQDPKARRVSATVLIVMLGLHELDRKWTPEDWRGAAVAINAAPAGTPVLVYPGLAESKDIAWLTDMGKREYLLSPLLYYQVSTPTILLPPPLEGDEYQQYFEGFVGKTIERLDSLMFVGLDQRIKGKSTIESWTGRLKEKGFSSHQIALAGGSVVKVFAVNRQGPQAPDDRGGSKDQSASPAPTSAPESTDPHNAH